MKNYEDWRRALKDNEDFGYRCNACLAAMTGQDGLNWDCSDCDVALNFPQLVRSKAFNVSEIPLGVLMVTDGELI